MNNNPRSRSKFGNEHVKEAGYSFASQGERDCYRMLRMLEIAGELKDLKCQVTLTLIGSFRYRADFEAFDLKTNETVWYDYKGFDTQRWRDVKKIWRVAGPGKLRVMKGRGLHVFCAETITPDSYRNR